MASLTPLVFITFFWLLIHLRRRQLAVHAALLPTTTRSGELSPKLYKLGRQADVSLTSAVTLRIETTALSGAHARLLGVISKRGNFWGNVVRLFYDCASVVAVLGQLFGIGILIWSVYHLGLRVMGADGVDAQPGLLLRRDVSAASVSSSYVLKPLIPGLTLPISHLPHILSALIACTAIHELGHAIAAAADGVPLLSWGYSLLLVVPIAFVELSATFPTPPPRSRLRIAGAGAYHNLLTIILLRLLAAVGPLWPWIGYRSATTGVVVVDVAEDSPLYPHLVPGSFVVRLDDIPLVGSSPLTLWSDVLLGEQGATRPHRGWCVDADWFNAHAQACCTHTAAGSCFIPHSAPALTAGAHAGHCINPLIVFENRTLSRCASPVDCSENAGVHACVAPHATTALLRLYLADENESERVVVWQGPRREVWEDVTVSPYTATTRLLPVGLPHTGSLLLEYANAISLSLFVINLLPVRALDGGEILHALMDVLGPFVEGGDADLEAGWGRGRRVDGWTRRAGRIQRVVEVGTVALVGVVLVGGAVL